MIIRRTSRIEALFDRVIGKLVALGMGPTYMRVLDVRGRKSGRVFSTPVNLLELGGVQYLVAPRGNTHWVRNVRATGGLDYVVVAVASTIASKRFLSRNGLKF